MPTNQVFAACLNVLNIGCVQLRECRRRRHMYLFLMFAVGKNRCSRTDFEWEPCKMCVASALPQTNLWCCTRGHYLGTKMISSPPKLATTVLRCNAYLGPYERRGLDRRTQCAPTLVPLVILMQLLVGVPSHRKIDENWTLRTFSAQFLLPHIWNIWIISNMEHEHVWPRRIYSHVANDPGQVSFHGPQERCLQISAGRCCTICTPQGHKVTISYHKLS